MFNLKEISNSGEAIYEKDGKTYTMRITEFMVQRACDDFLDTVQHAKRNTHILPTIKMYHETKSREL
jgi:hypothetical protein